jgi:hypothetical protein
MRRHHHELRRDATLVPEIELAATASACPRTTTTHPSHVHITCTVPRCHRTALIPPHSSTMLTSRSRSAIDTPRANPIHAQAEADTCRARVRATVALPSPPTAREVRSSCTTSPTHALGTQASSTLSGATTDAAYDRGHAASARAVPCVVFQPAETAAASPHSDDHTSTHDA